MSTHGFARDRIFPGGFEPHSLRLAPFAGSTPVRTVVTHSVVRRKIVHPGFEPGSKPPEGFRIGRYPNGLLPYRKHGFALTYGCRHTPTMPGRNVIPDGSSHRPACIALSRHGSHPVGGCVRPIVRYCLSFRLRGEIRDRLGPTQNSAGTRPARACRRPAIPVVSLVRRDRIAWQFLARVLSVPVTMTAPARRSVLSGGN